MNDIDDLNPVNESDRPTEQVLDDLFGEGEVSPADLFAISDMSPEQQAKFADGWPAMPDDRRRLVARHLADLSEANFEVYFGDILRLLLDDPLPAVRAAALEGLWDSEDISLITRLLEMVGNDDETEIRALAAATLGHYVLHSQWGMLPAAVSPRIVTNLLSHWDDPETAPPVRRAILETVGSSDNGRVPVLIESAYAEGDDDMQLSALFAMGASADERWLHILIDEMENPRPEIRVEAARSAGRVGSAEAVPMLADLTADEDLEVRLAAIYALGQIGGDVAREVVTQLVDEVDDDEVSAAIDEALSEMSMFDGLDFTLLDFDPDDSPVA